MDIAALSTAMSSQKLAESAGTAVLKMALDNTASQGASEAGMLAALPASRPVTDPALGNLVDIQV